MSEQVDRTFNMWWPQLEATLAEILAIPAPSAAPKGDREIMEEILESVQALVRSGVTTYAAPAIDRLDLRELFTGSDVIRLVHRVASMVGHQDGTEAEGFDDWGFPKKNVSYGSLDGEWQSRWNGGAESDHWIEGFATCITVDIYSLFLFQEWARHGGIYALICCRDSPDWLIGRYINLKLPEDSTPWVGRLISNRQIDGYWMEGRWDFRR